MIIQDTSRMGLVFWYSDSLASEINIEIAYYMYVENSTIF